MKMTKAIRAGLIYRAPGVRSPEGRMVWPAGAGVYESGNPKRIRRKVRRMAKALRRKAIREDRQTNVNTDHS